LARISGESVDIFKLDSTKPSIFSSAGSDPSRTTDLRGGGYFLSELAGAGVDAVAGAAGAEVAEELSELEDDLPESDEELLLSLDDFGLALP
jgi:hypothetical protein